MRKKLAAIAIVAGVGLAASAAFAYWTQGGSGDGSATAGDTIDVTVNQADLDGLYPGQGPVTLSGDFDNPNEGPVKVGSVTVAFDNDPVWSVRPDTTKPACTIADFELGGTAVVNAEIDPGNGEGSWTGLTIELKNSSTNQDNCKNASVPLSYSVSPAS